MACELDELENNAAEARQRVAECRSLYPNACSNIFKNTLKLDIKTSMAFRVDTGNDNAVSTKYHNNEKFIKLGLRRRVNSSFEAMENLEERLAHISKALDVIGKNKTHF